MPEQPPNVEQQPAQDAPAAPDYRQTFASFGVELPEGTEIVGDGGIFADESWAQKFAEAATRATNRPDPIIAAGFENHVAFDTAVVQGTVSAEQIEKIASAGLPRELVEAYVGRSSALASMAPEHYRMKAALAIAGESLEKPLNEALGRVESLINDAAKLVPQDKIEDLRARLGNPETCIDAIKELNAMSTPPPPPQPPAPPPAPPIYRGVPALGGSPVDAPKSQAELASIAAKALEGNESARRTIDALRKSGAIDSNGRLKV